MWNSHSLLRSEGWLAGSKLREPRLPAFALTRFGVAVSAAAQRIIGADYRI
jgi:hypothetical protein